MSEALLRAQRPPLRLLEPVISTKIMPPRVAAGLVDRQRLLSALESEAANRRLTLINAPAGFGKTSIAAAWCEQLKRQDHAVAWVTLDPEDDEPIRFITYIARAMALAVPGAAAALEAISGAALVTLDTATSILLNELSEAERDVFLFLDDYQNISAPKTHEAVARLLRHAPTGFHLVIVTSSRPLLRLASLRAAHELLEFDAASLLFDIDEIERFVENVLGRPAREEDVCDFKAATDGWPAGLRILAAAGRPAASPRAFLSAPSAVFADYLGEVLSALPAELAEFMLLTSILENLTGPLCEAVTGMAESQHHLQALADRHLFVTRLNQEGLWFRYHRLLSECLRARLKSLRTAEVQSLHRRACWWYAARAYWPDAVHHAIAAGELGEARLWIEKCVVSLVGRGDLLPVLAWHRSLPPELFREQLHIELAIARALALAMRFDEAASTLDRVEAAPQSEQNHQLIFECQAVRAMLAGLSDDSELARTTAEACLRGSGSEAWDQNALWNCIRFGEMSSGNLTGFFAVPMIVREPETEADTALSTIYQLYLQGNVAHRSLRPQLAEELFRDAISFGQRHVGSESAAVALPASLLAHVLYETNRIEEAEELLLTHFMTIRVMGLHDAVLATYKTLAQIAVTRSNDERALLLLRQGQELGQLRGWPRVEAGMLLERIRLACRLGQEPEINAFQARMQALVAANPVIGPCSRSDIHRCALLADAYIALSRGRPAVAKGPLSALSAEAIRSHRHDVALRVNVLLAAAHAHAGDIVGAEVQLVNAAQRAIQGGMHRTIADEATLLEPILSQGSAALNPVRAMIHPVISRAGMASGGSGVQEGASHVLGPREREVLSLIAEGQSNKEVARILGVSPETVKTYLKNTFVKLSVGRRAQAVLKAQSLGLLRTS